MNRKTVNDKGKILQPPMDLKWEMKELRTTGRALFMWNAYTWGWIKEFSEKRNSILNMDVDEGRDEF